MFGNLEVLQAAQAMARHAAARQNLIAQNVAQADTPGYRSRDLVPFSEIYGNRSGALRATRPGHIDSADATRPIDRPGELSPNGNSVSLEVEMVASAEVKGVYDRALAIYGAGLDILRASLGRIR